MSFVVQVRMYQRAVVIEEQTLELTEIVNFGDRSIFQAFYGYFAVFTSYLLM